MADSSSEHIIRLIVQGLNRLGNMGDQVARETQKMTGAQEKHTKSVKDNDKAIEELRKEYARFVKEVKDGNKDYDDARLGLARLASEFDKLSRRQKIGSALSEDLNKSALAAKRLSEQLKTAHETEQRLGEQAAKDRTRREEERQRLTQQTIAAEIKEEQRGVQARQSLLGDLLGELERDHNERKRFAKDLADFEIKEAIRVEEARARSRASRPEQRFTQQQPGIVQRIRGFLGGGDDQGGVRRFTEDTTNLGRTSGETERRVSRLDRTIERLHGTADRAGFSVAKIDNNLRGLAVLGVVAFSQQLISAFVALGSTMLAVATTAVQAGAALGGAFVAGATQAIPMIGLLIAAFGRVGAVFKAVDLFNQQATRSGRDQAAAADAQAAAADRVTSAQEGVAAATQRVQDATDALSEARHRAIQNITDLNLAERKASLSLFESQNALRQAVSSGDVGALEGLRLRQDEAGVQAGRAGREAAQGRAQGVEGSDAVRQAVQTLQEANVALGRARREMAAANRAATQAAEQTSSADQALKEALALLSPAELALYQSVRRIQARFKTLFRPITDIIVGAFSDAVDRVSDVMGDRRILGPLRTLAETIATSIRRITRELTNDRALNFFKIMATESARNIPLLTTIAIRVSRIAAAIAVAAGPALRQFIEFLGDIALRGEEATNSQSGLSKLQAFFLRGEEYAESIARLTGAFVELFLAVSGAGAADTGQSGIDQLTEQVQKATDWVNDHQAEVRQFFEDSLSAAKAIAVAAFQIAKAATELFDNEKVQSFAEVFTNIILPALTTVITGLGAITFAMSEFLNLPVVGDIAQMALSIFLLHKAFSTFAKLLGPMSVGLVRILGNLPLVGKAFRALAVAMRVSAAILSGPWGVAIAAAITALVLLDRKFHFLGPTIKFISDLLKDVLAAAFDFVKGVVISSVDAFLGAFTQIAGAISSLASAASHLPFVGDQFKGVADAIDKGRDTVDRYRESLRKMNDEHKKTSAIEKMRAEVITLKQRLFTLKEGSEEYRSTARKLEKTQDALNNAMATAEQKGKKGARGPRALGRSAASAAEAVDEANKSIVKGYNSLAGQLGGIKKITYSASGVTVKGRTGSITADTGDITAGRAMGGWMGGQHGGPQGPDDIHVLAGRGEAFLNVPQQGPVEEGLALRSMLMGGPGSLTDLFRQYGGAFAAGGRVGGIDLKGAGAQMMKYARDAAGYGLSVSSGLRAGSITSSGNVSLHASGRALDLVGSATDMLRYARHAVQSYGRQLAELIHTPLRFGIKAGKRVPLSFWGARVNADHVGHVHVGGGATGLVGGLAGATGDLARQRIRGPEGMLRDIAQRAVNRITRAANDRVAGAGPSVGREAVTGATSSSPAIMHNISLGQRMARAMGWIGQQWQALKSLWQGESGWDAKAVNRSSGAGGIPQALPASKMGAGWFGRAAQQIRWGLGYIKDRYGSPASALSAWQSRSPHWYQGGGIVGGASRHGYRPPTIINTSFRGILGELARAQEAIRSIQTRGPNFVKDFTRSVSTITDDGGLLDLAKDAIQRVVDGIALKLRQATFKVTRSGLVVQRLTPEQQNLASLGSLDAQRVGLQSLRGATISSLADVDRRLSVLRRGGVGATERKAYETLVTARRALVKKIEDVDVAIAEAVEARFNAQVQILQDGIDEVNQQAQRRLGRADLADRVATVLQALSPGLEQASFALRGSALQSRAGAMIAQRDQLARVIPVAQALGRNDVVADLIAQIEELNVSLLENAAAVRANTTAARQATIDAISRTSQRALARLDLHDRQAGIVEAAGNAPAAFAIRGRTLQSRGEALNAELAALGQVQLSGATTADIQQAEDVRARADELRIAIQENTAAILSNTVAARQSAIDRITNRGGFLGTVLGGLSGIIQTVGTITGSIDVARLHVLAVQAGQVLNETGAGLRQQLVEAFGLDLRGLTGTGLVDRLRSTNFDALSSGMTVEQRTQFESLINAVIENAGAVEQNTLQIRELSQNVQQSFSSTAWQLFRQAIFTGSGGLLPQFVMPHAATGGYVARTGMAVIHQGETILRADQGSGEQFHLHVSNPSQVLDPGYVFDVMAFKRSTARAVS